jgi:hypothetical protein
MAISHRATGTATFSAASITPGIPAGSAAGDMMLMLVGGKPYNSSTSVSGWTSAGRFEDGTTAAGTDSGSMFTEVWYKEHTGSESNPTLTEGGTTWNVVGALIMSFQKGGSDVWSVPALVGAGDTSAGTGWSATSASTLAGAVGDFWIAVHAFNSDAATPCTSHPILTHPNLSFGTVTHDPATDPETTTGGDMGMCITREDVNSGGAAAAPGTVGTLAGIATGSVSIVRLVVSTAPAASEFPYIGGGYYP